MHAGILEGEDLATLDRPENSAEEMLQNVLRCRGPFHEVVNRATALLQAHPEIIAEHAKHFALLDPLIEHIEEHIFCASEAEELCFRVMHEPARLKILNDAYCAWETALEQQYVDRLCQGTVSTLQEYRLNKRFQRLLRRETSLLRQTAPRRALFIGSGPFPISAIWLHYHLGIPVDGLDVCGDAARRSRQLLDRLGMGGTINVIHEPSMTYDVSAYDVILVALLAKPKLAILENICRTAKPECEVICRTSFGLRSVIYEPTPLSREILDRFSVEDVRVVSGASDDTISSLLLRKMA